MTIFICWMLIVFGAIFMGTILSAFIVPLLVSPYKLFNIYQLYSLYMLQAHANTQILSHVKHRPYKMRLTDELPLILMLKIFTFNASISSNNKKKSVDYDYRKNYPILFNFNYIFTIA